MTPPRQVAKPGPDDSMLRISAAAKAAGVHPQTIEYYILIGLIKPIRQPGKTGRYFSRPIVRRIRPPRHPRDLPHPPITSPRLPSSLRVSPHSLHVSPSSLHVSPHSLHVSPTPSTCPPLPPHV
ncbi:MAG: MerR family DNA-binding transcriptional regulator [Planctomycetota bacterium]|nr:MerR family DNA-binding transcriptional regulator [Planctomycetota bacterium]